MKSFSLLIAALLFAGCVPMPEQQITASTPAGVTVSNVFAANGDFGRATTLAQEECQRFGRDAARVPDDTPDGITYFNCVD